MSFLFLLPGVFIRGQQSLNPHIQVPRQVRGQCISSHMRDEFFDEKPRRSQGLMEQHYRFTHSDLIQSRWPRHWLIYWGRVDRERLEGLNRSDAQRTERVGGLNRNEKDTLGVEKQRERILH